MTKKIVFGFSILIILLEILFAAYSSYINLINLQLTSSNLLSSEKSVTFFFKEDSVPPMSELIKQYPSITLFSELYNNSNLKVLGIYGKCQLDSNTTTLVKGRFFNKSDFNSKNESAVVGIKVLSSNNCFKDKTGQAYFLFNKKKYKVIGTMESDISNMLDNTAFVNLDSIDIKLYKFIIDGDDSSLDSVIAGLKTSYDVEVVQEKNNFIKRYVFDDLDKHILDILVLSLIGMLVITISMYTIHCYHEEISVKRIIGVKFQTILLEVIFNISTLTIVNTAFIFVMYGALCGTFLNMIHFKFQVIPFIIFVVLMHITICLVLYIYMVFSNNGFHKNGVK